MSTPGSSGGDRVDWHPPTGLFEDDDDDYHDMDYDPEDDEIDEFEDDALDDDPDDEDFHFGNFSLGYWCWDIVNHTSCVRRPGDDLG